MTLHPTPGHAYPYLWTQPNKYPFTLNMTISCFRQIRAVLHLVNNDDKAGSQDMLFKIRPLMNTLKLTLASYVDVGDELALDEATVVSKSKFGRHLIKYNPHKPGADGFHETLLSTPSSEESEAPPDGLLDMEDIDDDDEDVIEAAVPVVQNNTTKCLFKTVK
eukprot:scaffold61668_cov69-Attheya_sp.AAC.4